MSSLRRTRAERGRVPEYTEVQFPRRGFDRGQRGILERAEDQGHASRDEERDASGGGGV